MANTDPASANDLVNEVCGLMRRAIDTPEDADLRLEFAYSLIRIKGYKMAVSELEAAQSLAVEGGGVWKEATYCLGRIYEQAGKKEKALHEYRKFADLDNEV